MHDAVSQALYGRIREPQGLSRMITISSGLHAALIAVLIVVPADWWQRQMDAPRNVMTISLGGAPGPVSGGMTPISGRPIQKAVEDLPKVQPTRPPAAKTPEMVEPEVKPRVTTKPVTPVQTSPKDARSKTPTVGAQERPGRAMAETGSTANSLGLSTGGGGTGGQITLGDFCCPEYLSQMVGLINRNWSSKQMTAGTTIMRFTIQRDGTLSDIMVAKTSGFQALDFMAQRALIAVNQLPPLPPEYTNQTLTINLAFEYQR
jgi:TonB family protein